MTCEGCRNPIGGIYIRNCIDCTARAIARSQAAFDVFWFKLDPAPLTDLVDRLMGSIDREEARAKVRYWWRKGRK